MIISYTILFLMLFSLLGGLFIQKYQNFKFNDLYLEQLYQPYIHRPTKVNVAGFNLRSLIDKDPDYCAIFSQFVDYVYSGSSFFYLGISSDLLKLFQDQATLNQSNKDRVYIDRIEDLQKLIPEGKLEEAYLHLMDKSKIHPEDKEGYPCLLSFFHPEDMKQKTQFNLFYTPIEIIEAMFGPEVAENLKITLREYNRIKGSFPTDADNLLNAFMNQNRLGSHPYAHLVRFQESR